MTGIANKKLRELAAEKFGPDIVPTINVLRVDTDSSGMSVVHLDIFCKMPAKDLKKLTERPTLKGWLMTTVATKRLRELAAEKIGPDVVPTINELKADTDNYGMSAVHLDIFCNVPVKDLKKLLDQLW